MRATLLHNLWCWKCGMDERTTIERKTLTFEEIEASQSNETFEQLRRNRMVMGFFRYGSIKNNVKKYDNVGSAIKRLQKYQDTGNGEHLVDASNLCMIEFTQQNHKRFHFESEDDVEHTNEI